MSSLPASRFWSLIPVFSKKEPGLFRERAGFRPVVLMSQEHFLPESKRVIIITDFVK